MSLKEHCDASAPAGGICSHELAPDDAERAGTLSLHSSFCRLGAEDNLPVKVGEVEKDLNMGSRPKQR